MGQLNSTKTCVGPPIGTWAFLNWVDEPATIVTEDYYCLSNMQEWVDHFLDRLLYIR